MTKDRSLPAKKLILQVCTHVPLDADDETKREALYLVLEGWLENHKILRSVEEENDNVDEFYIYGKEGP